MTTMDATTTSMMSALESLSPRAASKTGKDAKSIIPEAVIRQCKAARALLGWPQKELAHRAKTTTITISRFERGEVNPRLSTLWSIQDAFAAAGVMFLDPDEDGGIGLRLSV
jgi:ribosome-binding protein aMBF1 (putative translation factor)